MSMVSSCNLLSPAPPLRKISRAPMQPGSKHAAATVALPGVLRKQSRRPLFVCHAEGDKHTYNIQPFALVNPKFPPTSHENWTITEDEDRINLWFFVERETPKDKLQVGREGKDVLVIKYKGKEDDNNPASKLNVRLLIPQGYEKENIEAELALGSLLVTVTKPKEPKATIVAIGDKPSTTTTPP